MIGIDYGYVSGVRRLQANNFQIGMEGTLALTEHVELFATINRSFAMHNLRSLGEGNVTWGGGGLRLMY